MARRDLLRAAGVLGLSAGLMACTREDAGESAPVSDPRVTPSAADTPTGAALPRARRWEPSPQDVAPEVKVRAVRLIEAAGTWGAGDGGVENARSRVINAGYEGALVEDLTPVLTNGVAAVAHVRVAQYGGILVDSASVLAVVDQWVLQRDGSVKAGGTTLDIRLLADEPDWTVTKVRPARSGRDTDDLSRPARRLLDNNRVVLPHAAESDIRAGAIHDNVLIALGSLSSLHRVDVSILRSGHPLRVFGTDRTSNHTDGLAVDIWALDGRPIIDTGDSPAVAEFMTAASEVGAYQVGGPVNPDGGGTAYFSDDTHEDHIHLGFTA
jgi:hypothetical protein